MSLPSIQPTRKPMSLMLMLGGMFVLGTAWLLMQFVDGSRGSAIALDLAQLGTMGFMGGAAAYGAFRTKGRIRLGLACISLTGAAWFTAQVLWILDQYTPTELPLVITAFITPVGYLVGTPLLAAAAMYLLGYGLTTSGRYRRLLDAALIVFSMLAIFWALYLGSAFRTLPDRDPITLAYLFVYPVGDATILALVATLFFRLESRVRRTLWPLALGFVSLAIADVSYAFVQTTGSYDATSWFVFAWMTGELLLAAAAIRICHAALDEQRSMRKATHAPWVLAPPLVMMVALISIHVLTGRLDPISLYFAGIVFVGLSFRHWLHMRELAEHVVMLEEATKLELRLQETRSEVTRMMEQDQFKTQLLNLAAHELNTPIAAIQLQLQLLKMRAGNPVSEHLESAFELLDRNVERLADLVANTLDVARLQSGRMDLHVAPTKIAPLIHEAVATFTDLAKARDVRLVANVDPALEAQVDAARLTQVIYNLVSNAIKFTPVSGEIRIDASMHNGSLDVAVQDSGVGMTPSQLSRLFQPFTQVHDGSSAPVKGTGLGLFISQGIVKQHGGDLVATSPGPGLGTRFRVRLPLGNLGASA